MIITLLVYQFYPSLKEETYYQHHSVPSKSNWESQCIFCCWETKYYNFERKTINNLL